MAKPVGRPTKYSPELAEIYSLSDPITGNVMYIGKANNSESRLKTHIRDSKRRNTPVYIWIKSLINIGLLPILNVLETTSDWQSREIAIINEHRLNGIKLLNVAKGGNEPFCSKETRAINGRINANKIHSDDKLKRMWKLKHKLGILMKEIKVTNFEKYTQVNNRLLAKGICLSLR